MAKIIWKNVYHKIEKEHSIWSFTVLLIFRHFSNTYQKDFVKMIIKTHMNVAKRPQCTKLMHSNIIINRESMCIWSPPPYILRVRSMDLNFDSGSMKKCDIIFCFYHSKVDVECDTVFEPPHIELLVEYP